MQRGVLDRGAAVTLREQKRLRDKSARPRRRVPRGAPLHEAADYIWVETLLNIAFKLVPSPNTTAMMATDIPAVMRPYSIAVAPAWSLRNAQIIPRMTIPIFGSEALGRFPDARVGSAVQFSP